MNFGKLLYEGKGKKIYMADTSASVILQYKNDLTAFNALKKGGFPKKGFYNAQVTQRVYEVLQKKGIATHFISALNETAHHCHKLQMIPLEVVIRNTLAGSTAKKFFMKEGTPLKKPLLEFFYKKDEWEDPFINDEQALMLGAVEKLQDLEQIKKVALQVNEVLLETFSNVGINLVDFKLEFGWDEHGTLRLGDEITSDSCRLWDAKTGEKLDKDVFRRSLGDVDSAYKEVYARLYKHVLKT